MDYWKLNFDNYQQTSKYLTTLLILTFLMFFSCNNPENTIPYKYVDITLDLNKPEFIDLKAIGNYVEITGGINGIIVYRSSESEFKAYERTCSYDPECERIDIAENSFEMVHNCCGSEFSLTMDGIVTKGPATLNLRSYTTIFYPNSNALRITSQ